jgi:hypothetical protein
MEVLGKILRTVSLAILFGGSVAIVFAAIVLVTAAKAKGVPVAEAAAVNAPVFITWAKVNLGCGIVLLIGEALDFARRKVWNKPTVAQYICSLICVGATMVFALGIVPPMERLLPSLHTSEVAQAEFHKMHEGSRAVFSVTILTALASLLLPIFGALKTNSAKATESVTADGISNQFTGSGTHRA